MKLMKLEDFENLKLGDEIVKISNGKWKKIFYLCKDPSNNHFIFSNHSQRKIYLISKIEIKNNYKYYIYDSDLRISEFIPKKLIEYHEKEISRIKLVYGL